MTLFTQTRSRTKVLEKKEYKRKLHLQIHKPERTSGGSLIDALSEPVEDVEDGSWSTLQKA